MTLTSDLTKAAHTSEIIDIVPDKSLMQKLGKSGYSLGECVAELTDNCIDSLYDSYQTDTAFPKVGIKVEIRPEKGYIQVEDDALGMDYAEAARCFKLAASEKVDRLGTYGLGLKGAALALGAKVTVLTTRPDANSLYRMSLDEDAWGRDPSWMLPLETLPKTARTQHGTVVRIERLRRRNYQQKEIDQVVSELSKRYSVFLKNDLATISVNGKICRPSTPELFQNKRFEFEVGVTGGTLTGWYGFLERGSQTGQYGFDTFWHNRMITEHDKFGFTQHPTLARLIGEVHMNHVPPQITKRGWQTDSAEYVEAHAFFTKFLETQGVIRRARELSAQAKITPRVKATVETYLDAVAHALRSTEVTSLYPYEPNASQQGAGGGTTHDVDGSSQRLEIEVEKREKGNTTGSRPLGDGTRTRTPIKTHVTQRIVRVSGKNYRFNHEYRNLGIEGPYKDWVLGTNETVEVYSNMDFPSYETTNDLAYYAVCHVAEALAEFICAGPERTFGQVQDLQLGQVHNLRDTILRQAGRIQAQL